MTDRTVKVSLILQAAGYIQDTEKAAKKTRELGSDVEKLAQKREAFNTLGTAAIGFGTAVSVGVGMAVAAFADFDQQMSAVQAATHETAANMDLLRDAAIEAGARTVYSASESANAIEELAKAGVSTADILGGALDGALDLAAAGGLGVAEAASIAATTLQQFKLDGDQAAHVADLLAAGAGKAMGDVSDLGNALKFVGPVANAMGVSLEETTGVLALFAQQGILGEQAGTSLRGVLASLTAPSSMARKEIERLGLTLYDSQGNFLGLRNAASELSDAYTTMDGASRDASLGIIFGRETMTAATALYRAGAEGVDEWTTAVNDAGYAEETAATRLDNLKGDWEALTGAVDSAMITMGEGANGPLREIVQGVSEFVDRFNGLPDEVQQGTLMVAGLTGALSLAVGGFMVAIPKIAEFNTALKTMGGGTQRAGRAAAWMGKAGLFASGLVALGASANYVATQMGMVGEGAKNVEATLKGLLQEDYNGVFKGLSGDVDDLASAFDLLLGQGSESKAERFGSAINVFGWADQVADTREQFEAIGESLAQLVNGGDSARAAAIFQEIADAAKEQGYSTEQVKDLMPAYQTALDGVSNSAEIAAGRSEDAAVAFEGVGDSAEDAQQKVEDLADKIRGFGSAALDTRDAHRQFEQAVDDLAAAIEENGGTLDRSTDSGRANEAALDGMVRSTLDLAAATLEQTGNQEDAAEIIRIGRDELLRQLEAFGITGDAAQEYADQLGLIPEDVNSSIGLVGYDEAMQKAKDFAAAIRDIPGRRDIVINEVVSQTGARRGEVGAAYDGGAPEKPNATGNLYSGGRALAFAAGGFASGIYPHRPGGIHKFAEAFDEAYITLEPKHRERNLGIWAETGRRLGAWQSSPDYVLAQQSGGGTRTTSTTYSPTIIQRPGVSDRRIAQVAQEEFAFGMG